MSKVPREGRTLSQGVQLAIVLAAVLAVAAGGWFLLLGPKRAEAADLEEQLANAQLRLTQARIDSQRDPAPPVETGDLFRLARAMPDTVDMSGILLELNRVATEAGIEFESISPSGAATVGAYQVVPVTLLFEGNFYSLSDFLFRLRSLVRVHDGQLAARGRLFNVDSVSFGESQRRFPHIRATLQVNAFVYGTGTPAATTAPATTAPSTTTPATTTPATTTPTPTTTAPTTPAATTPAPATAAPAAPAAS
ncbi:MAG TPA: type 4a pilus biogenesis protein PilO [Gaiellaceae bacterium]|nr:type 4a pilus biogenesis protein PilO [Gaiellaceae bacterium]